MCGIAGILDFDFPIDPRAVRRMTDVVAHRGPDSEGYYTDQRIGLGSRRLAIVDVEGGEQPTSNEEATIHVVFNGEIYNHRQLRSELANRGHCFRSYSDTEVIPHLYEEKGIGFVEDLDGVFAIALWDLERQVLILARDRVGVKPLFYRKRGRRLVFASEVKGVLASGDTQIAVDPQGLSDCFFYGQPVAPGTFWSGVKDMLPGSVLAFSSEGLTETVYYRPFERVDPDRPLMRGREAVAAFSDAFTEAVRKRLPDEVKWGTTLSGGIDSTAVAAIASRYTDAPLSTYTIRLPGEILDEGSFSRYAAQELRVSNEEISITGKEACEILPQTLWHLEAPQWFGVAPPFYALSRRASKEGIKVALTGDGADELLGGYDWYRVMQMNRRFTSLGLGWLQPPVLRRASKWIGSPEGIAQHLLNVNLKAVTYRKQFGEMPGWIYVWSGMQETIRPLIEDDALLAPSSLPPPPMHEPYHQSLYFEFVTRLPNWVLVLSDRLSMAHGLEVRVPYMDRHLLDLATELDPQMMLHNGVEKYVMKKALQDVVPPRVRQRRKKPFFTPVTSWFLSGPGAELTHEYLSEACIKRVGIFVPQTVNALWKTALRTTGSWEGMLAEWAVMMVMSVHILVEQFARIATEHF